MDNSDDINWEPATALIALILSILSLGIGFFQFIRETNLYPAQIKPIVSVVPIRITQLENNITEIEYNISNYTGFGAKGVTVNSKFEDYGWVNEWIKADADGGTSVQIGKVYESHPVTYAVPYIGKGQSAKSKGRQALTLETDVCNRTSPSLDNKLSTPMPYRDLMIWTTWDSENGHTFSEVNRYRLLCNKANNGKGRAFAFFPMTDPTLIP